jgi:hypothetical protein
MVNLGHVPCGCQQKNSQKPLQFAGDPLNMPRESRRNRRQTTIDRESVGCLLTGCGANQQIEAAQVRRKS